MIESVDELVVRILQDHILTGPRAGQRGWERSVGARLETQVAATCGLKIEFQP